MIPARLPRLAALCAAVAIFPLAHAKGDDELWEMTIKMEMQGMPMGIPAQTSQVCMEAGKTEAAVPKGDSDCRTAGVKRSGGKTTFRMECTRPQKMTGTGEITRTKDRMSGTIRMKGDDMDVTQTFSGRRVGSCDAASYRQKQVAQMEQPLKEARAKNCSDAVDALDPSVFMPLPAEAQMSPEERAATRRMIGCDDYKDKFCAKAGEVTKSMRVPKGYLAAYQRYRHLDDALRLCSQDPKKIEAAACKSGVNQRDWQFVSDRCPAEAKDIAAANCVGRDYTEVMSKTSEEYLGLCSRYAPQRGMAAAPRSEPAASEGGKGSTTEEAIKEGTNVLRKFLKF